MGEARKGREGRDRKGEREGSKSESVKKKRESE